MRIFVTGATGYIGGAVSRALRRAGHEVFGLCRSAEKGRSLARAEIHPVLGDMTVQASYAGALAECSALVHCAADHATDTVAADATVVDAFVAAAAKSPKTLVYTSGVWVIGNTGDRAAEESDPLRPLAKVAWRPAHEQTILTAAAARSVVLRPGCVYGGAGGLTGAWFAEASEGKPVSVVGDGRQRWAMVHLDDLADAYVRAVESGLSGEAFNLTDPSQATVGEMTVAASRAAGASGVIACVPLAEAAKTMGPYAECLAVDQRVDSGKARRLLGWQPRHVGFVNEASLFFEAWKARRAL